MHGIPASFATHAALANQVHKHKIEILDFIPESTHHGIYPHFDSI